MLMTGHELNTVGYCLDIGCRDGEQTGHGL